MELVLVLSSAGAETRTIVGLVLKHIVPIALGDKTTKEDKPDQAMDRERGEERDRVVGVEEKTELETEIVTSHDRAFVRTRKRKQNLRNYSPSKTSVSGMGGGTMSTSTTSSLSTPGLSTSTRSKVMGMVKEWSRKGADLPDQFVRGKSETNTLKY